MPVSDVGASAPPSGEGWRLRPYREGDERRIVQQIERVFQRPISEEYWRWKLKTLPSPTENVWLGVDREDRPIFQYAAVPRRLHLPGGEADALVLVDLWTDPAYRERRIFSRCSQWVHERWARDGVACVLSPFNAREEDRYRRLGWRYLLTLRWQIRPLRPEAIAARRLGVAGLQRWRWVAKTWNRVWGRGLEPPPQLAIEDASAAEITDLDRPRPGEGVDMVRGGRWLRWRYLTCPRFPYTVLRAVRGGLSVGYLAYRIEETDGRLFGFVAELAAWEDDPIILGALIDAVIERLLAHDVVAVATLGIPRTDLYRAWRRRGFLFSWGSFHPHCLPLRSDLVLDAQRDPKRWSLCGGDFDVI